jgi:uncharacterized protein YndB with AHSA1/START domain
MADRERSLEPVVRDIPVKCDTEGAFEVFTDAIGAWWPPGFSASGDDLAGVVVEGRVGGRVYEYAHSGGEYDWGTVTAWEPGRRLVLAWTLGVRTAAASPTQVEVRIVTDRPEACRLRLEHRGWQPGQEEDRKRFADDGGWAVVLDAYRTYAEIA